MTTLITGASKGIGQALAHEFAAHGHDVVLASRDEHSLNLLATNLRVKYGVKAEVITVDLSRPGGAMNLVESIEERGITIDCLVNNAGIGYLGDFIGISTEHLNSLLQLNVIALTELTHHYAQVFSRAKKGKILQVASVAAFQPGPRMATYYASKAYVVSMSQALAYELEGSGVGVSILCPGPTDTNFFAAANMSATRLAKGRNGMMSAEQVAKIGYREFAKNKLFIIPGFRNKLLAWGTSFVPASLSMKIVAFVHRKQ
ncbi:SDR family NAD(P)-dependent oxidoreductase [Legionella dresdenensis]|uniref:SDR family NAD(P)-dependent oxidoreductase n=1 Tax=Legionella dresdenensis TaxID=450200 RepID=A0ABV8CI33_9GAMM